MQSISWRIAPIGAFFVFEPYDEDQVDIVNQMETDYLKADEGEAKLSPDTEELLRIIQDNPELLAKLLAAAK